MKFKINRKEVLNYFYGFLLIACSAIPLFRNQGLLYFCLLISLMNVRSVNKFIHLIFIFITLLAIEFYHYFYFAPLYDFSVVRVVLISFFIAFVFAIKMNLNFIIVYIKILHILSIISLFIYLTLLISVPSVKLLESVFEPFFSIRYNIYDNAFKIVNPVFFNFDGNFYSFRNNGPFWEPTIFATFLILSIIFNLIVSNKIFNKYNIISFIALVTTLSTTGFIAFFFLLLLLMFLFIKLNYFIKVVALFILIYSGFYAFKNLDFLQSKITAELTNVEYSIHEKGGDSRVASTILDWKEVTAKPQFFLFGKGSDKRTRIGGRDKNVLRNNGLTALLVQKGIFLFVLYLVGIYFTFHQLCIIYNKNKLLPIVFFFTILILSNSEILFDLLIFHFLAVLGLILYTAKRNSLFKPPIIHA
jgi:hypothetical protein